jgi:serine/threonine-protein kinase
VHYGLVSEKERDIFGDAVNLAERIKSAAAPDQILVSRTLHELARANRLIVFASAGMYDLKGHAEPVELFELMAAPDLGRPTLLRTFKVTHRRYARYYALAAGALVLAALVALQVPAVRERVSGAIFGPAEKHIAMLPFDNIGNNPENEALAEGLMDSMTGELSNLDVDQKQLWVVPASVVRARKIDDPQSALKEFGATLVIKGSVQRAEQDIALTLNLINTKTLRQIGSVSASSSVGDLASVERQALVDLGRLLNVSVAHDAMAKSSSSTAAYDLYIEALGYIQRYDKPGNLDVAIGRLRNATAQDSNFALGFAAQGEAYRLKYQLDKNPAWLDLALENCGKAAKLDPQLAGNFVTLGRIHEATGKHELAVEEFRRALAIDSRNADAIKGLAIAYDRSGRLAEAEEAYKRAAALRPEDWDGYNSLALFYDSHARYDEAIAQVQHAISLSPDNAQAYTNLGAFYLDTGDPARYADAERAFKKSLELAPNYQAYGNLGQLYLQQHRYTDSISMIQKALSLNDRDIQLWAILQMDYEWLKDKKQADAALAHVLEIAERWVRLNPGNGEAQSWLALAYARTGSHEKARTHIESALGLAPNVPVILINAIEAYDTVGDEASALRLIQQAQKDRVSLADLKLDPARQSLLAKSKLR